MWDWKRKKKEEKSNYGYIDGKKVGKNEETKENNKK